MKTHKLRTMLIITLTNLLISTFAFAQSPEAISYQAVARNNQGEVLANQSISFRISLLLGSITGTAVYKEKHTVTTNQFGLANLEIGRGTVLSGSFTGIDWGANTYYVKIEIDPAGGTNYQAMGTSQMLSVPYSLYSKKSSNSAAPWITSGNNIFYDNGNVGIGTVNPEEELEVNGHIRILDGWSGLQLIKNDQRYDIIVGDSDFESRFGIYDRTHGVYRLYINGNTGVVGVCELRVASTWCDYVFDDKYKLMDLNELEKFIQTQKHLPGIPTASQVENDGLYVGDMSKKMMEKIEELTLYVIDLNKSIDELRKENESLKKQIKHSKH